MGFGILLELEQGMEFGKDIESEQVLITSLFCHFLPSYDRHTGRNKMGKWLSISGIMLRITP